MKKTHWALVAVTAMLGWSTSAQAEDCHCDCYFSFDCAGGAFCDYGSSFTIEDECWWRTPKPEGSPGTGCGDHYGDWGQCDGKCTGTAEAAGVVGDEPRPVITAGLEKWWAAFNDAALSGGGAPSVGVINEIQDLPYTNETMSHGLWRMVVDVMMLARGEDFIIFPQKDGFYADEVALGNLVNSPARVRNGDLAMQALLAEMNEAGAGIPYIARIDADALDTDLFSRFCEDDLVTCLYGQIYDMGRVLSHSRIDLADGDDAGDSTAGGGPPPQCPGCPADCEPDDQVNVADMLNLLSEWGSTSFPYADINQSGNVDIADLLVLLSSWGNCA